MNTSRNIIKGIHPETDTEFYYYNSETMDIVFGLTETPYGHVLPTLTEHLIQWD